MATGAIDRVAPGSPADAVMEVFGAPDAQSTGRPTILKYGALEVTISGGQVELLHVEFHEALPPFVLDSGLSGRSSRDDVERLLDERGLVYEPYPPLTFDGSQSAIVVPGAVVVFDEADRLYAISSSAARSASKLTPRD